MIRSSPLAYRSLSTPRRYGVPGTFPIIVDIDGDGDLEIGVGEYGSTAASLSFYVWDLPYLENSRLKEWPMYQHDQRNSRRSTAQGLLFRDGFESGDTTRWSSSTF